MKLSKRAVECNESGTVKFMAILNALRAEGKDIIDFTAGQPDLAPPKEIINATKKALDNKKTRYCIVAGIIELRKKIADKLKKEKGADYDGNNIIITNGAKQALYNIFQVICNHGDEVIIPKPCWVSFPEQVKLAGGKPVFVDTNNKFQLDIEKIKKAITKKTKAIIINSPSNPTGAVFRKEDLLEIAKLAVENDFLIISDDTYDQLVYDDIECFNVLSCSDKSIANKLRKNTIIVNSLSKTFSMTGFRIGYAAAEKEIIDAINRMQSHLTGNVCTFVQYGALAAFDVPEKELEKRSLLFQKRRDLAFRLASELFYCVKPQGAFYLFVDARKYLSGELSDNNIIKTSEQLAEYILNKAGVAMVAGESFGMSGYLRISYSCDEKTIKEGFKRINKVLGK
ncbi:MAG: pyridoxal phosphate-dependent aminotransferase [Candidatus Woesearchaeota archaeon]